MNYFILTAQIEKDFKNFKFYVALSEPLEEDTGRLERLDAGGYWLTGFVHQVVIDKYLNFMNHLKILKCIFVVLL